MMRNLTVLEILQILRIFCLSEVVTAICRACVRHTFCWREWLALPMAFQPLLIYLSIYTALSNRHYIDPMGAKLWIIFHIRKITSIV